MFLVVGSNLLAASASPYLLPSHQKEVDSSDVDANVVAEILEDFPYGGTGPESDGRAGAVGKHHTAMFGGTFPYSH